MSFFQFRGRNISKVLGVADSGGAVFTLTPLVATLILTGASVALSHNRNVTPTQGSLVFSGQSVTVKHDRILSAGATGHKSPTAAVGDTVGDVWSNPTNVFASDGTYAVSSHTGPGDGTSEGLLSTGFGFSIPTGAVIDGIEVIIEKQKSGIANVLDSGVFLLKNGVATGSDKSSVSNWLGSDEEKVYGGAADLWGDAWTPADINNANFGVSIAALLDVTAASTVNAHIDHISITVYYHTRLLLTGSSVTLQHGFVLTPLQGSLVLSPQSVTVTKSRLIAPTAGALVLNGQSVTLTHGFLLTPLAGSLVLNPQTVTITKSRLIAPTAGALVLNGQSVLVSKNRTLTPVSKQLTLSGQSVTITKSRLVAPTAGALVLSGQLVELTHTGSFVLTPLAGHLTLTPSAVQVLHTRLPLTPTAGALLFNGQSILVKHDRLVVPSAAALLLSGQLVELSHNAANIPYPPLTMTVTNGRQSASVSDGHQFANVTNGRQTVNEE